MDDQELLDILQELADEDILSFKWQLRLPVNIVGGLKPLTVFALDNAKNRESLVSLIRGKYTNDAQEIVIKALKKIGKHDLADMLANIPKASGVERPQSTQATASGVERPQSTQATDSKIVTEKQLMQLANTIGKAWRRIGISLGVSGHKLEQIEENHPRDHVDRVYQMLKCWRRQQRKNATAAHLHAKLAELDEDLEDDDIDFLLEEGV